MSLGYNLICRLIFSIACSSSLLPKYSSAASLSGDVTGWFVVDGRAVVGRVGVAVGATGGVGVGVFVDVDVGASASVFSPSVPDSPEHEIIVNNIKAKAICLIMI